GASSCPPRGPTGYGSKSRLLPGNRTGSDAPAARPDPRLETVGLPAHVQRVLHYRIYRLDDHLLERLHDQFEALSGARTWRCDRPWIASTHSRSLFEMEYFRHTRQGEPANLSAAGFVKMAGDETDALIITIFLRDMSAEYGIRSLVRHGEHPLAKLRRLGLGKDR